MSGEPTSRGCCLVAAPTSEARHQLQEVTGLAGQERQVLAAAGFLARADRDATTAMLERQ